MTSKSRTRASSATDCAFITVRSPALRGHRADICCWAPPLEPGNEKLPLAVLLHGAAGSAWSWPLRGGAHLTTARLIETGEIGPLALAMPSDGLWGGGSGYVPHPEADYERWIVEEVAAAAALADDRIDPSPRCSSAACRWAASAHSAWARNTPDRFRGISAHSAVTTVARLAEATGDRLDAIPSFGQPDGTALHWMDVNAARLPPLRFDCGSDDHLLPGNRALHAALDSRSIDHLYEEFAGGHDWLYWRLHLADTLRFFDGVHSATKRPLIDAEHHEPPGDCRPVSAGGGPGRPQAGSQSVRSCHRRLMVVASAGTGAVTRL